MKIAVCDDNLNELELIRTLLDIYKSDSIQTFTVKCFESSVEPVSYTHLTLPTNSRV